MNIRPYSSTDLEAIVDLFTASVHALAKEHYDAEQREAWAPRSVDLSAWTLHLDRLRTLVAELDGDLAGFVAFDATGHIDLLYVAPHTARRKVATMLYEAAETVLCADAITELTTEASAVARPFFERQGFYVEAVQTIFRGGVVLTRFAMKKRLGG
jgi:putative acetyltransferase